MALPELTPSFKLPIPATDDRFWQNKYKSLAYIVDGVLARYIAVNEFQGAWDNSTVYTAGQTVVDTETAGLYQCAVSHTSAASPATLADDIADNPTYWTDVSFLVRLRGTWAYNTAYNRGDFVVSGHIYAMCVEAHTTGSCGAIDDATNASFWSFLIDATDTVAAVENQTFRPVQIKSGAYGIVNGDKNNLLIYTGSGDTWTIDGTGLDSAFEVVIENRGTGSITLNPAGVQVVAGAATYTILAGQVIILTKRSTTEFELAATSYITAAQNAVLAGPSAGGAGAATMRALTSADVSGLGLATSGQVIGLAMIFGG